MWSRAWVPPQRGVKAAKPENGFAAFLPQQLSPQYLRAILLCLTGSTMRSRDCRPGTEVKHREERRYAVQKSERPSGHQQRRRRTQTENAFAGTARRRIPTRQAGPGPLRRCRDTHHSAALSSSGQAAERPQLVRLQPGIPGKGAPRRGIVPRLLRAHTGTY